MKIDKNIPIPNIKGNTSKYPWSEMEVGDSFILHDCSNNKRATLCSSAIQWSNRCGRESKGIKFRSKRVGADVRIWRVK